MWQQKNWHSIPSPTGRLHLTLRADVVRSIITIIGLIVFIRNLVTSFKKYMIHSYNSNMKYLFITHTIINAVYCTSMKSVYMKIYKMLDTTPHSSTFEVGMLNTLSGNLAVPEREESWNKKIGKWKNPNWKLTHLALNARRVWFNIFYSLITTKFLQIIIICVRKYVKTQLFSSILVYYKF